MTTAPTPTTLFNALSTSDLVHGQVPWFSDWRACSPPPPDTCLPWLTLASSSTRRCDDEEAPLEVLQTDHVTRDVPHLADHVPQPAATRLTLIHRQGAPWMFALSQLDPTSTPRIQEAFANVGNEPLGAWMMAMFQQPDLERNDHHWTTLPTPDGYLEAPATLWGHRFSLNVTHPTDATTLRCWVVEWLLMHTATKVPASW